MRVMALFALLIEIHDPNSVSPSALTGHRQPRGGHGRQEQRQGPSSHRFRTIQVCPKALRVLPGHPEPAV